MKNPSLKKRLRHYCMLLAAILAANATHATSPTRQKTDRDYFLTPAQTNQIATQQQAIAGVVRFDGMPMSGVTVSIKDKNATAVTDLNGQYAIAAQSDDTLVFSYTGFETQTIPVNGQRTINTTMAEDITALQEITINAGYYKVKDKERTGSIAKIEADAIDRQPVTNLLATMQGQMAGVNVTQETGVPGGGFALSIRGLNSLRTGGNAPLYIIDGVPYATDAISNAQTSTSIPGDGNPLGSINPGDIETIEVLKDADATAIYGSRGANGVVLITTRKAKAGKTAFTLTASHGGGSVARRAKLMNTEQYIAMRKEAFANDGITDYPANAYDVNGKWDQTRYTDWQEELIGGTADIMALQGSASGGGEQTRFLLSVNYRTESTVFPGDGLYKKGGARLSLDHNSTDGKFSAGFSGSYTAQRNKLPWIDFVNLSTTLAPNAPALYDAQGELNWAEGTWQNPLVNLYAENLSATQDLIASTQLRYRPTGHWEFQSGFGFTDLHNADSRISPSTLYNPIYNFGPRYSSVFMNQVARQSWIVEPQLNWHSSFGQSKLEALVGGTFQNQTNDRLVQTGSGFPSNALIYDLTAATTVSIKADEVTQYKYQAFFARLNYNYAGRYLLNLTGRRDGSSRFGPGKQFANFGAAGLAWLFYKEPFLSDLGFLSFGKLRGSYGTTGNDQIGDYQFLNTYGTSGYDYQGIKGLQPERLYNADFGWESNRKLEAAAELGFLDDKILLTAAWYRNRSSDQLVGYPLPGTTGFNTIQRNLDATVENSGTEITLRTVNYKTAHFNWTSSLNLTVPRSRLLSFPGLEQSGYKNQYSVGAPVTIVKLFHFKGVDPETGYYQFEDYNGDGAITYEDDLKSERDLGPKCYGGLQNQISYKGLQLDFLFQFVQQDNYNFAATQNYAGTFRNQPVAYVNHWQQPGDVVPHQQYTSGQDDVAMYANDVYGLSDATLSDASYIRLKTLSLSFDFPAAWMNGLGCRLFAQGQNLWTITHYKGADPEFTMAGTLPPLRVISAGLQLSF